MCIIIFLVEHYCLQSVIYNFKLELKFWKNYSVVKIIILMIVISQFIIQYFSFYFLNSVINHL
jgi:hypothetical protein